MIDGQKKRGYMRLIVATHNQHKLVEIRALLAQTNLDIVGLKDLEFDFDIEENADSFIDNALLKAKTIQSFYPNDMILADDSGFSVLALDNKPGVHSSRFLGHDTPDYIKNQEILKLMENVSNRKAMFTSAMAIVYKHNEFVTQQVVYGTVSQQARGTGSFGYDPLFIPEHSDKTFAEDLAYKSKVSHRAKALKEIIKYVDYLTQ